VAAQNAGALGNMTGQAPAVQATTTSAAPQMMGTTQRRNLTPQVEEVFDEE